MSCACRRTDVHVVAGVPLQRVELAELVVLDEQVDEHPLAAAPRALEPLPVGALVGQRLRRRPVLERRPADRVVRRACRDSTDSSTAAVAAGRGCGRGSRRSAYGDAVLVPRLAAVHLAAEELEGHPVGVRVDVPAHLLDVGDARRAGGRRRRCRSRGTPRSRWSARSGYAVARAWPGAVGGRVRPSSGGVNVKPPPRVRDRATPCRRGSAARPPGRRRAVRNLRPLL